MVLSPKEKPDRFTQEFDRLIELPCCAPSDSMGKHSLSAITGQQRAYIDELDEEHTPDHLDCPACQATNRAIVGNNADMSSQIFREASGAWMRLRRLDPELKPATHEATQGYLDALTKFFHALRLRDVTPGHVKGYQIARSNNVLRVAGIHMHPWKRCAGNSAINHELSVLGQMMTHCRLWHRIKPYYFPLGVPQWSSREILSEEEEEKLWEIAAQHPEASLAYWAATITNNTSAAGIELRGIRLKSISLRAQGISEIYISADSVKNGNRPRKIALNSMSKWAVEQCYKRALQLGSCEPEHFLFPFRVRGNGFVATYDPTRPPSRWFLRNSWNKLRKVTGFVGLNPHDLRHHCITRLLENDVNEHTVISIAGHVSKKMLEYYSHHRRRVKHAAVMAIEPKKKPPARAAEPRNQKRAG